MYLKVIFKKSLVRKKPKYFKTALLFQFQVKSSSDGDVRHSLIPEVYQTINSIFSSPSHAISKSQIFVQSFNFDKTPTFSRVFFPIFKRELDRASTDLFYSPSFTICQFCPICNFVQLFDFGQFVNVDNIVSRIRLKLSILFQ